MKLSVCGMIALVALTGSSAAQTSALQVSNALSELAAAGLQNVARTNLGLGNSATQNVGTTSSTVAAGNDSRILGALQGKGLGSSPRNGTDSDTPAVSAARTGASNAQVIHLAPGILYTPGSITGGPTNVVWQSDGPLYKNNGTSPLTQIGNAGDLLETYLQGNYGTTKYLNQSDGTSLNTNSTFRVDRTLGTGTGTGGATPGAIFPQCTSPSGYA